MFEQLQMNELLTVEGGANALKIIGGVLLVVAGIGSSGWGGAVTVIGGLGCIIDGLDD